MVSVRSHPKVFVIFTVYNPASRTFAESTLLVNPFGPVQVIELIFCVLLTNKTP